MQGSFNMGLQYSPEIQGQPTYDYGASTPYMAIASTAASLYGSYLQYRANKETNITNRLMAAQARLYDRLMWERQNIYNSPLEQMRRLKAAGLNPKLIYGSSANTGLAGSPPKTTIPNIVSNMAGVDIPNMLGALSAYTNIKNTQAATDNIKANIALTNSRNVNEALKSPILSEDAKLKRIMNTKARMLLPTQVQIAEQSLKKLQEQNLQNLEFTKQQKTKTQIADELLRKAQSEAGTAKEINTLKQLDVERQLSAPNGVDMQKVPWLIQLIMGLGYSKY